MPSVRRFPKHNDSNGWWNILPDTAPPRVVKGVIRVKTAIIGGGICGISVANRLGELCPADDICIIEAEQVGFGASGRNAGFMLNMHSHGPPKNLDVLVKNRKFWQSGLNSLREKVEKWQIQCNWSEVGRFYTAAGPRGERRIAEISATLSALDLDHSLQDRKSLQNRLGTTFYSQGVHVPGNALVNPAAMMRGLAKNLPQNVQVFENSPVTEFTQKGDGYRILTAQGEVIADRLVLATGVFLKDFGIAAGKYVPMATYASLSEPLDAQMCSELGSEKEFGLLGGSEVGSTIRLTQDNRLFVRNYYQFEPSASASRARVSDISKMHQDVIASRWPTLSGLKLAHSWGGAMAFTMNNGSIFGEFGPNLFGILTNDVSPITRGEATGALLAEHIEGIDSDLLDLQLQLAEASQVLPRPILDIGISLRRRVKYILARKEV